MRKIHYLAKEKKNIILKIKMDKYLIYFNNKAHFTKLQDFP